MGSERTPLIDVELARTEFRLDVLKLREELGNVVPALRQKASPPAAGVVERASDAVKPPTGLEPLRQDSVT